MAYLDAAAAAPLHPVARQALQAALEAGWADPTRLYTQARRARQLLDAARASVADSLGVRQDEVHFTPSGTDSVRLAIRGVRGQRDGTVVHSAIEHSSVLYEARRGDSLPVPVDRLGRLDLAAWEDAVATPGVVLAALISASHEVGTTQPVGAACAAARVPVLVDACQSVGWGEVAAGWSLLAASAHKWGGPAGVGLLVVRKGIRWEHPERSSPVNIPAVVAAAAALRAVRLDAAAEGARLSTLVDRIRATVPRIVPDVEVVGDPDHRLPHIVTFSCLYVDGEALLHELDRRGFAVSSGSSCTADTLEPSHVLVAMGVLTHGNIRISLPPGTTEADVTRFLAELPDVVSSLRAQAGVGGL